VHVAAAGLPAEARLNVYRNTLVGTLTTALRLSFPAIHRLVGTEFFESAARLFIEAQPPRSAYLNDYGETFPQFLADFPPAASVPYLPEVARLEWAVNHALHAIDVAPLDLSRLSALALPERQAITFVPHPSISLLAAQYPVDAIWRAVLDQNDVALANIHLRTGPVWLIVERQENGVEVSRFGEPDWKFALALFSSLPLQDAIDAAPEANASILLADHLSAGRIVDFQIEGAQRAADAREMKA
jgi:hypothetical protein